PFAGGTAMEKLRNHALTEPVPVEQRRKDVPAGMAAVVRKLMAKHPGDRFQSPAELATVLAKGAELPAEAIPLGRRAAPSAAAWGELPLAVPVDADETIAASTTPSGSHPGRRSRKRRIVIFGAGGLLLLGLIGFFLVLPSRWSEPNK